MPQVKKVFNNITYTLANTEVFGMTAEVALINIAIRDAEEQGDQGRAQALSQSRSLIIGRSDETLLPPLQSGITDLLAQGGFAWLPGAITRHTGRDPGVRGAHSKCPWDFLLNNGEKLSVKTNKYACPPEIGQPNPEVFQLYFGHLAHFDRNNREEIKQFIHTHIHQMLPLYLEWLFSSDYLMTIIADDNLSLNVVPRTAVNLDFEWHRDFFTSTRTAVTWKESNSYSYNGVRLCEVQFHRKRSSVKVRFELDNLITIVKNI